LSSIEEFIPQKKFDVILMNHVIEHLQGPIAALEKIKNWVNDDGIIYIRVPNLDSKAVNFFKSSFLGHSKPFEHLYYFNTQTLGLLLRKAGLEYSIYLDSRGFLRDIINYRIRSYLIAKSSWVEINYGNQHAQNKVYLFSKKIYENILSFLGRIPFGPSDKEIVAVAKKIFSVL
jgi:2-polyprenyl-3-methyl-5-hydroxy-6-metoxy-1,4-benzoquinol methylase